MMGFFTLVRTPKTSLFSYVQFQSINSKDTFICVEIFYLFVILIAIVVAEIPQNTILLFIKIVLFIFKII